MENAEAKNERELDNLLNKVGGWGPYQVKEKTLRFKATNKNS